MTVNSLCPFCGKPPVKEAFRTLPVMYACKNKVCPIFGVSMSPRDWEKRYKATQTKFKHLKVGVPEGIGDIIWVYRKCMPYCEKISFIINHVGKEGTRQQSEIQHRSDNVAMQLPNVKSVSHQFGFPSWTHNEMHLKDVFAEILPGTKTARIDYICNALLDRGVYLEDIDRDLKVQWDMKLETKICPEVSEYNGEYIVVYISGDTERGGDRENRWNVDQWVQFLCAAMKKIRKELPVIFIGAKFDEDTLINISKLYERARGRKNYKVLIAKEAHELFYILKNCRLFIGYQSGLNILADEFNTKQLILYFTNLRDMKDSWVKPINRKNGKFNYAYFGEPINNILDRMNFET